MRLKDLLDLANAAYPDHMLADFYKDADGTVVLNEQGFGDTLAKFVVNELIQTFEPDSPTTVQLDEAIRAMEVAQSELGAVIAAFERAREMSSPSSPTWLH